MAKSCKRMRTLRVQPITGMALQISSLPNMQTRPHSRTPALQTAVTDASYSNGVTPEGPELGCLRGCPAAGGVGVCEAERVGAGISEYLLLNSPHLVTTRP